MLAILAILKNFANILILTFDVDTKFDTLCCVPEYM